MKVRRDTFAVGLALLAASSIWLTIGAAPTGPTDQDCLQCHSDSSMAGNTMASTQKPLGKTVVAKEELTFQVTKDSLKGSVHEGLSCVDCHEGIKELPHAEKVPAPTCRCHGDLAAEVKAGVHAPSGKAGRLVPGCADCHGAHQIRAKSDPASSVYPTNIPGTCGACHSNTKGMEALGVRQSNPLENFLKSDHWKSVEGGVTLKAATCADCHGAHKILSATDPQSPVYKRNVPATCGKCHKGVEDQYVKSVHGKSLAAGHNEAPSCADCHGEHDIENKTRKTSKVFAGNLATMTCGECHSSVRMARRFSLPVGMVKSYEASFHGLASKYGDTAVANCGSCHGVHDILPSSDPKSSINPNNLQTTCGKCHPGAGATFAQTPIHLKVTASDSPVLYWIQHFYILIIALTLGGMALHQLLDYIRRYKETVKKLRPVAIYLRMDKSERVQHVLLLTSFLTLVATGFALKWPDSVWALPFLYIPGGFSARGWIHRLAAVVMVADSLYHVYYLIATKRGRSLALGMLPTLQDGKDLIVQLGYYLGYRDRGARFSRFSYAEKAEYLALVWGTVVMVATGFILWFKTFFARFLPDWGYSASEMIHLYEAILAFSAIVIWHFYAVFSHTEKSPYNSTWLTGRLTRHEMERYHPRELEEIERQEREAVKAKGEKP